MWNVVLSSEVAEWYAALDESELAQATRAIQLLADEGHMLRMPHCKYLADKLWELRFRCGQVNRRITYTFEDGEQVITLTTFHKQRQNEAREIKRARRALTRHQQREEDDR